MEVQINKLMFPVYSVSGGLLTLTELKPGMNAIPPPRIDTSQSRFHKKAPPPKTEKKLYVDPAIPKLTKKPPPPKTML